MADQETGKGHSDRRFWARRSSLTVRILAVNAIALGLLAGSIFYLDNYRRQLIAERFGLARAEAEITSDGLESAPRRQRPALLGRVGAEQQVRLQLYNAKGDLLADSFELTGPAFKMVKPDQESAFQKVARVLDRSTDLVLGAPPIPEYLEPTKPSAAAWPEIDEARTVKATIMRQRIAPDGTPVITAAALVGSRGDVLLTTRNAIDVTEKVRDARQTLAIIVGAALVISILLSLFLARTIVQPLQTLVRAAIRVRLGRDREVVVPRLPERRDEIGMLARAISDMSSALRQRIDSVETFAADVAHEIKNPLASLRSALESMTKVEDPDLRRQLTEIAAHDVRRIDRLVTEIADASRIDAELSRTKFEPVDMLKMVTASVAARDSRGVNRSNHIVVTRKGGEEFIVPGDAPRLERVLENLLDNAVSFSPERSTIEVLLRRKDRTVEICVSDHGPGIPVDAREKVFERFHSLRPAGEDFGSHSGLGLAIARTIVEAHYGALTAMDRSDGGPGARLVITLPLWENP